MSLWLLHGERKGGKNRIRENRERASEVVWLGHDTGLDRSEEGDGDK